MVVIRVEGIWHWLNCVTHVDLHNSCHRTLTLGSIFIWSVTSNFIYFIIVEVECSEKWKWVSSGTKCSIYSVWKVNKQLVDVLISNYRLFVEGSNVAYNCLYHLLLMYLEPSATIYNHHKSYKGLQYVLKNLLTTY